MEHNNQKNVHWPQWKRKGLVLSLSSIAMMSSLAHAADNDAEGESNFHLGGYVREAASVNLQNHPETNGTGRGELSMLRSTLMLNADAKTGPVSWTAIGRLDKEYKTNYLTQLENINKSGVNTLGATGPGSNLMDMYNKNELREFYADTEFGRVKLRLGKQQVVWGETDFFHAMDVVNGFNYSWRSFLEPENEELRKPLIMANAIVQVPEANGSLQLLYRPGIDRDSNIGNTYDIFGGRWAAQPNKGVDFLSLVNYDYRHPAGDAHKPTGGLRWSGVTGPINYSLAYLTTYQGDPVFNSVFNPYQKAPTGALADAIFPKIQVIGATVSGQVPSIDAVLSTELVFTKNAAFNVGTNFAPAIQVAPGVFAPVPLPGLNGIKRKDTFTTMVRMDKTINLAPLIGTSRPSFFSLQLFNTRILGFDAADDLVDLATFNAAKKRDTTIATAVLAMNYMNDRINPQIAAGYVVSSGEFLIPSVDVVLGDKWRLKVEADLFFTGGKHKDKPFSVENSTRLIGYFTNNNQLMVRLTRQF